MFPRQLKMPQFTQNEQQGMVRFGTEILDVNGRPTIHTDADILLLGMRGNAADHTALQQQGGVIIIQTAVTGKIGLMYALKPESARQIGTALHELADMAEAAASNLANAALKKAAGK